MSFTLICISFFYSIFVFSAENISLVNTNIQWSQEKQGIITSEFVMVGDRNYNVLKGEIYPLLTNDKNNLIAELPLDNLDIGISVGKNLSILNISNLNFLFSEEKNFISLDAFNGTPVNKPKMELHKLEALCGKTIDEKSMLSIIFSSCFNNGQAKLETAIFPGVISGEKIDLNVVNHKFQLAGNLQKPIQGFVKIKGISNYDLEKNELIIEVQSAKLEILNIRGRLFKELSKVETKKIKVKEPFIIISFN